MFYNSSEIDADLECSFCKQQFVDEVKFVPGCGESICGHCHQDLKENLKFMRKFECKACKKSHSMPKHGLTDNRGILKLLGKRKVEKPLSESAKTLERMLESFPCQLKELESFDEREHVNQHCDLLEVQVVEEIDSLVKHLNEIETDLLKQIREYREKCLELLDSKSSETTDDVREKTQLEVDALRKELDDFGVEWNDYFLQLDSFVTDSQIDAALNKARYSEIRMRSLIEQRKNDAFSGQVMRFQSSHTFLGDHEPLRRLVKLCVDKKELQIRPTALPLQLTHSDMLTCVVFLSDRRLASCSFDSTIKIWDVQSGLMQLELKEHTNRVVCLAVLENGWLASGSADCTVKIWDLGERRAATRTLFGHTHDVVSLKALKHGCLASYSTDQTIKIWDPLSTTTTSLPILSISGHDNAFWYISLEVLPNEHLVTCSRDKASKEECVMKEWNASDGALVRSVATGLKGVSSLLALSSGEIALGSEDGTVKVFDQADETKTRTRVRAHDRCVSALVQLSSDRLASSGRDNVGLRLIPTIKVWHLVDLSLLQTVETSQSSKIVSLCLSPGRDLLASGSYDKTIQLWPLIVALSSH